MIIFFYIWQTPVEKHCSLFGPNAETRICITIVVSFRVEWIWLEHKVAIPEYLSQLLFSSRFDRRRLEHLHLQDEPRGSRVLLHLRGPAADGEHLPDSHRRISKFDSLRELDPMGGQLRGHHPGPADYAGKQFGVGNLVRVTLVLLHLCRDCKFFVNLRWPDLARLGPNPTLHFWLQSAIVKI